MNANLGIYGADELDACSWPDEMRGYRAYFASLMSEDTSTFITNVTTKLRLLQVNENLYPLTINDREYDNSYVCSPYTGVVSYPLDELWEIRSRGLRLALSALIRSLALPVKVAAINRVVVVNNWMLSTNLYPTGGGDELEELTEYLVSEYPSHAILFRSLNRVTNARLCDRLEQAGYLLAPSRQVYIVTNESCAHFNKVDCKRDLRLLDRETDYRVVPHADLAGNEARIQQLYDQLYLEKYSYCNPQFTSKLFRLWLEQNVLEFMGLKSGSGSLDAVVGYWAHGGVVTSPLVGYDTSLPQELGLYRMLAALILRQSWDMQHVLHLSSGVSRFKRHRGAVPTIEYTAVYCRHLPLYRRCVWQLLAWLLTNVGARLLERYEL